MSENLTSKSVPGKKAGLGRGLGSLLGGQEGSFSKTVDDQATAAVVDKVFTSTQPMVKEGFLPTAPLPVAAAPNTSAAQSVTAVPAAPPSMVQSAVLSSPAPKVPDHLRIWQISIDQISPNPLQPRQVFNKENLNELAASIKEKGILQPITARKVSERKYEIIAGERRWRAAQLAGLHEVPVIIKDTNDQEVLELALIENIQRSDLNPLEEAEAYDYLMSQYGLTQQQLANKIGKDRATVANVLRVLSLVPEVRQMVSTGEISLGQAKVLLSVGEPDLQKQLALRVKKENLTVRALEKLAAQMRRPASSDSGPQFAEEKVAQNMAEQVGEELQTSMGTKVSVDYIKGRGKISIHFYSTDEFNDLVERLRSAWPKLK